MLYFGPGGEGVERAALSFSALARKPYRGQETLPNSNMNAHRMLRAPTFLHVLFVEYVCRRGRGGGGGGVGGGVVRGVGRGVMLVSHKSCWVSWVSWVSLVCS